MSGSCGFVIYLPSGADAGGTVFGSILCCCLGAGELFTASLVAGAMALNDMAGKRLLKGS